VHAAGPGSIIIFHDGRDGKGGDRAATVKAVTLVVNQLHERSYSFVTVDRLLDVPAYQAPAGQPARE